MLLLTHQPASGERLEDELHRCIHDIAYPENADYSALTPELEAAYISTGYFSSVWAVPGNPFEVIKVSHRPVDACRHYMQWVFENPHPNAPKIHSIEYLGDQMYVRMERYYPLEEDPNTPFEDSITRRENVPGNRVLMGDCKPDHRLGHEQLCATIRRQFVRSKFDLHKDNVMVARDGRYIITDPVSFSVDKNGEIVYDET